MLQEELEQTATNQRPTAEVIYDYINRLRVRPIEYIDTFDEIERGLKKQKGSDSKTKSFTNFINEFKVKPAKSLQRSGILNELAGLVAEKFNEIKNLSQLSDLVSENYSGVSHLAFYSVSGKVEDGEKIVNDLLLDEKNRKDFFSNNTFRLIGVNHRISEEDPNNALTVILIADEISEGSEKTFTDRIAAEINNFRSNPASFANHLENAKNRIRKEFPNTKKEFIKELETLIETFKKRNIRGLSKVTVHEGLSSAAREHLDQLEQKNSKKFYAQDQDYLNILISHYATGFSESREFISVDMYQPLNLVIDYLVNEKDKERNSRKALLNSSLTCIGLAHRIIKGTRVTAVIFTDKAEDLQPVSFEEGLVQEINKIRAYPKSYVKYFQSILDNNEIPKNYNKKQQETFVKSITSIIEFLQNAKSLGPLISHNELDKAAKSKLNQFVSEQKVYVTPEEKLRDFLGDYGTGFYNVAQLDDVGSTTPIQFLVDVLIPRNSYKNYRDIIFSRYLNYVGVAGTQPTPHQEVEEGQEPQEEEKIRVLILSDHFEQTLEKFDTTVVSRQVLLKRPNLTDDEIIQIKADFKLFDVVNTGHVKPGPILYFMDKSANFSRYNFVYYEAFRLLDTEENNSNGVDVEEFINAVKKVMLNVYEEDRWKDLFNVFLSESRKKAVDYDVLRKITNDLKYKITDEDVLLVLERLQEGVNLDLNKFTEIMKIIENFGR
jgi:Ca2+-binding EF-hand superfamily protein